MASSIVRRNGSDRPTTVLYSSGTPLLSAQISASDVAAAGTAAVTVFNPTPGGGSSNPLMLSILAGGMFPQSIAVDSSGKFAYVANAGCLYFAGNVSMYKINPTTGALASIGSPVPADLGAHSVAVDPSGKFAYVANMGDLDTGVGAGVSAYTINPTSGALTSIGTIEPPSGPFFCYWHPEIVKNRRVRLSCISRITIIKTSTSYFVCASPATTAATLSSI